MPREPPCWARRPGSRDGAEWEALWAAQTEAEVKEGQAGAGEAAGVTGPPAWHQFRAQDRGPGLRAQPGELGPGPAGRQGGLGANL